MDKCPKDCHKKNPFIFRKVVIPASVDDDRKNPPKNGAYCNVIVYYEASENSYIYSSDGIPTRVSADLEDVDKKIAKAVGAEAEIRYNADQELWTEIETIEAASDVVDVVGTYAELESYDTSKLQDNDLIKVLQDETRDDAITYYRWSTSTETFSYVGEEGPYYTQSQTNNLLNGKQDTLIAGSNIQIASDGKTISATDTTYSTMTGATASVAGTGGLVPAPAAGDQEKALKGDGTWGDVSSGTIFYMNSGETGNTRHLYKASDMTGLVTMQDIIDANEDGQVTVRISTSVDPASYSDIYLQNAYVASGDYQMIFLDNQYYYSFDATQTSANTFQFAKSEVQRKLTAGTNITINGNTISATDTTYSDFTGTDGLVAGAHGLVPAPATTDAGKFLSSDGSWEVVPSDNATPIFIEQDANAPTHLNLFKNQSLTITATIQDLLDNIEAGNNMVRTTSVLEGYFTVTSVDDNTDGDDWYIVISGIKFSTASVGFLLDVGAYTRTCDPNNSTSQTYLTIIGGGETQKKLNAGANISIGTVSDVPNTISVTGMPVLYGSQGQNTDGAVTQKVFTDTVGDVESILQILNSGAGV